VGHPPKASERHGAEDNPKDENHEKAATAFADGTMSAVMN
jgi:hypothetical protein